MENPNFIFSSGPVELKEESDNFFVEGYISTSDLDLVNDVVTKDCIMDMAEQMKSRTIKLDVEHESFRGNNDVEIEINKTIIPAAKIDDFLVDKKGLRIRAMLNKHVQRFNEVKNSIKDGFLDAFSIAFIPTKARIQERNGQEVRMLDKINLLNVAFTGNPVNTHSSMTNVFAKSLEFLKDQENHIHKKEGSEVSERRIKLKEVKKMSEEDNKEETQEAEKEEKPSEESESKPESEEKAKKKKPAEEEEDEEKKKVSKKDDEPESEESKEEPAEEAEESKESEETETKSEIEKLKKEMMEVKAVLKKPMLKSRVEQKDKSENFAEEKALNPLDIIA